MRLEPINKPRTTRPPTRSFIELAKDNNLSAGRLRGLMVGRDDAPKPVLKFHDTSYYEPTGFNRWLKARLG